MKIYYNIEHGLKRGGLNRDSQKDSKRDSEYYMNTEGLQSFIEKKRSVI
jgi:hypothetical protein